MKQVKRKGSNGHLGPMRRVAKAQKAEGSIGGYRIHFTLVFVLQLLLLLNKLCPWCLTPFQQGQHEAIINLSETVTVHQVRRHPSNTSWFENLLDTTQLHHQPLLGDRGVLLNQAVVEALGVNAEHGGEHCFALVGLGAMQQSSL